MRKTFLAILFFAVFFQFINADIVSVNSGGGDEIIINPDTYIESLFSGGDIPVIPPGGGEEEQPPGGGGGPTSVTNIIVIPTQMNISMTVNTSRRETIKITNNGTTTRTLSVSQTGLDEMIILNTSSITLSAGETRELKVIFVALEETGTFAGKIFIDGKTVYVYLNIYNVFFDSNIIVLNENYLVPQGEKLRTSVTLIPLGEKKKMDVTLNYVIKDYDGRIYLTRSETVLVENQVNFRRDFDTGFLPLGKYIVGLELIYPSGVAPSSAHFEITVGIQNTFYGKMVFFLINAILIVLILIIIIVILRIFRQMRVNEKLMKGEHLI